ncbi:hypothetical protein JW877_09750, partial [bacterium]|nr:hypothetical protein [bacterium]
MIILFYTLITTILFLLGGLPMLLFTMFCGYGLSERLGFIPRLKGQVIWIHTSSVGEVRLAAIIIPRLKEKFPQFQILLTTITKTGKEQACKLLGDSAVISFMPLDHQIFMSIALRRIRPVMLILTESELWHNMIRMVSRVTPHIFMINGRVYSKTFNWARWFKLYFIETLAYFQLLLMKTQADAQRLILLGAPPHRVKVLGDLKFAQKLDSSPGIIKPISSGNKTI